MPGGSHAAALSRAADAAVAERGIKGVLQRRGEHRFFVAGVVAGPAFAEEFGADGKTVRFLHAVPVISGGRPPAVGERDRQSPPGAFDGRIRAVLDRELRLETAGGAPGEQALLGVHGQRGERREGFRRRQLKPVEIESAPLRLEEAVGRRAGEIVERAARRALCCPQFERVGVVADVPEEISAHSIESEIECGLEIPRQICPGDLQAMSLEIVDQDLAETAFLAQLLLGSEADSRPMVLIAGFGRHRGLPIILGFAVAITGAGGISNAGAFDKALVQAELAVGADRDDAAGAGVVFLGIDRKTVDNVVDLGRRCSSCATSAASSSVNSSSPTSSSLPRRCSMRSISAPRSAGISAGRGRTRPYCTSAPYSRSRTALVQAQRGRSSAALASSFSIASRRTSAASSMKPSSSPLKRSRAIVPPAASKASAPTNRPRSESSGMADWVRRRRTV